MSTIYQYQPEADLQQAMSDIWRYIQDMDIHIGSLALGPFISDEVNMADVETEHAMTSKWQYPDFWNGEIVEELFSKPSVKTLTRYILHVIEDELEGQDSIDYMAHLGNIVWNTMLKSIDANEAGKPQRFITAYVNMAASASVFAKAVIEDKTIQEILPPQESK